jgi:hypothetical protein
VSSEERIYAETHGEFRFTFTTELRNLIAFSVGRVSEIGTIFQSCESMWKNFILKVLKIH